MVFSTPTGTRFVDPAELERMTGEPVRSEYRMPGTGTPGPPADAVLACPLTFNSVNKFAHGHADNFAVGLLCEMVGSGAADFRNSPLSITGIPQGTSGAEGLG